jgi:hypothetical protein
MPIRSLGHLEVPLQMVFGKLMSIPTLETDASIDCLEHALLSLLDSRVRIRFVT